MKLNFDGALLAILSYMFEGLILNSGGDAILSFLGAIGVGSVNKAEIEALLVGIREARKMGFLHIVVEGDSLC